MSTNTIAQVANQSTGLFIGITEDEGTYTVRAHGDGYLVTTDRAEAITYAADIAADAKDEAPAEDIDALDAFIAEIA